MVVLYNSYTDDKHGNRQGQELYFDDEGRLVEEVLWKNEAKIWQKSFTENEVYQHTYFLGKDNRFSKALEVHVEQLEAIGLKPTL